METIKTYTREQLAELLHTHINTISILREEGVIDGIKIGKNYVFPESTVINFLENYMGLDCSNRKHIQESKRIVDQSLTEVIVNNMKANLLRQEA